MAFYEDLLQATQSEQIELQNIPIIRKALAGNVSLDQYIAFLTQAYHHVKHTVPLLTACSMRLAGEKEWLRTALAHYVDEEIGHEEWILDDITACGGDAEAVRNGQPALPTELMVAYAYYTISRGNPVGFLGMVHVLEGTSVQLAINAAQTMQRSLNLPDQAFTYLNSHGSLDLEHVDYFRNLVNQLDSDEDKAALVYCAKVVYRLYGDIFRSLEAVQ